jgi:signal transduction histidine kinase
VVRALGRLRWQLTLSHLIAIAFTLVSMIVAVVVIGSGWWSAQNAPSREPAQDARLVADATGGLLKGTDASTFSTLLRALAQGDLRLVAPFGPPTQRGNTATEFAELRNVAYIVVVAPDGQVLGSSDPAGASFDAPERQAWQGVAQRALSGTREDVVSTRPATGWNPAESISAGPAALGAAPIIGQTGQPVAAVIVGVSALAADDHSAFNPIAAIGVASLIVLSASFVFALASSSLVAYLLSRRLVHRLEELGRAAEALRSGKLAVRVPADGTDEVAQLQHSFNAMAADLEQTLHELSAERDRVAGLLESRRQLVAGVSHELRTPVATVRGYLESALRRNGTVSTDLRADLETMQQEIGRLQRLIDDLFLLSRSEVGRLELRQRPTDVGVLARRLVETQAPLAWRQRRVELVVDAPEDLPPAWADDQRLEQILSNLVSNAVRHTPPGGVVSIGVSAEQHHVRVDVRDTGEGIPSEDLPRVFERFYRGRAGDAPGGAGLGLALVKELTEAMGGNVHVESTAGEGSCFTVCIPRSEARLLL